MQVAADNRTDVFSGLKDLVGENATSEDLFDLVLGMYRSTTDYNSDEQIEMCEDVLNQLIAYVENDARQRISEKMSNMEDAPRRVIRALAIESIKVAEPVLIHSPVLEDVDLLMVTRMCGPQHLKAIASRDRVSEPVTNELVRLGNNSVWETIASNNGAELSEKATTFLVNRANDNKSIQMSLVVRPDLADHTIKKIVSQAGESLRSHLVSMGRQDLLSMLKQAEKQASNRILSTSSTLGFEYERASAVVQQMSQKRPLTRDDLMVAAQRMDFPLVSCIFAEISRLSLEETVHWLSRKEVDPAIIAFKSLRFNRNLVEALLKVGPWSKTLSPVVKSKALRLFDDMKPEVADRIFATRVAARSRQNGVA